MGRLGEWFMPWCHGNGVEYDIWLENLRHAGRLMDCLYRLAIVVGSKTTDSQRMLMDVGVSACS